MAEEDIIFGKNRHFFGGIEPSNMLEFSVYLKNDNVRIKASLPKDTMVDGQTLCTVAGAVIRRKEGSYPVDEFDGDAVANITRDSDILDPDADTSVDQYYAAFPYSTQGVYNRNAANRSKFLSGAGYWIFGYDLDIYDPNPDTRVSYPSDVDNYGYTPVGYETIDNMRVFAYGDWPSTPGTFFMPKPCMLTYDGVVDHYLDPNNYAKREDGVTDSRVSDLSFDGNAMMEWPKIYTHREMVDGVYKFRCSDMPWGNDWECWCNYDINDNQVDNFYTAIYPSYFPTSATKFRSISGVNIKDNNVSDYTTLERMLQMTKANGQGWTLEPISERLLIQDLLVMLAKSTDGQTSYGNSITSGTDDTYSYNTGVSNRVGMFFNSPAYKFIKVFGMESWWGVKSRRLAGLILKGPTLKIKVTPGTHDGSSVIGYNATGDGYIPLNYDSLSSINGYINNMSVEKFGRLPIADDGSSTTYECDYAVYNTAINTSGVITSGGSSIGEIGPFAMSFNSSVTNTVSNGTGCLSYRPIAKV